MCPNSSPQPRPKRLLVPSRSKELQRFADLFLEAMALLEQQRAVLDATGAAAALRTQYDELQAKYNAFIRSTDEQAPP